MTIVPETWIWYSITMLIVSLRFLSRYQLLGGFRGFQYEDYAMLFVACTYTVLIVFLNIVVDMSTNLIAPQDIPKLTPQDIAERTRGSKLVIVTEQMMISTVWGCKACLLLLYHKLTVALRANLACKIIGAYVVVTFVVMEILYFGVWCRPFSDFWKTPTHKIQCATQTHHLLTNLVFNLSSDVLILSIPLPLLLRSSLSLNRKIVLVFVFSLAFFVMLSAILSKVASFREPFSSIWVHWYARESSMAVIVSNMPHCWALLRRIFKLKSFISNGISSSRNRKSQKTDAVRFATLSKNGRTMATDFTVDSASTEPEPEPPSRVPSIQRPVLLSLKSTLSIKDHLPPPSFNCPHGSPLHIWQEKEFIVREETNDNPRKHALSPPFNKWDLPGPAAKLSIESASSSSSAQNLLHDHPDFLTSAIQPTKKGDEGISAEDISRVDSKQETISRPLTPLQPAMLPPIGTRDVPRITISAPPAESSVADVPLSTFSSASSSSSHPPPSRSSDLESQEDVGSITPAYE